MVDRGRLARGCPCPGCGVPPLGAEAPPGGCGAAVSPAGLWPPTGLGGGGEGERGGGRVGGDEGFPAVPPWSPGAASRWRWGGGVVVLVLGAHPATGGAHSPPTPLYPLGARPSCRPSLEPPALLAVAAVCPLAWGGGGGAAECWGRRFGSAVSG